jgi:hypothetical protein
MNLVDAINEVVVKPAMKSRVRRLAEQFVFEDYLIQDGIESVDQIDINEYLAFRNKWMPRLRICKKTTHQRSAFYYSNKEVRNAESLCEVQKGDGRSAAV